MDFVKVFPLILALISRGQCNADLIIACNKDCPAGYHLHVSCSDGKRHCKQCGANTYTEIENTVPRCLKCAVCTGTSQIKIKPCNSSSNTVCGCKEGYYNNNRSNDNLQCQKCNIKECPGSPSTTFQMTSQKPTTTATPVSATTVSTPAATLTLDPTSGSIGSNSTPHIVPVPHIPDRQFLWLSLMVLVVIFLLLLWLLMLLNNNLCRNLGHILTWRAKKNLESPVENFMLNEQPSHRSGSPTTLTWITEENPRMPHNLSPPVSDPPALLRPLLPDSDHLAATQCEKSDHWPAIVLYAIIKEVPLRRWKEFLRLLNVADHQLERVELEAGLGLGSMERQYQMLRLWSQCSSASLNDVFSALHYMDLSGCAQLLQESLEKMQWRSKPQQDFTDQGSSGTMQHA